MEEDSIEFDIDSKLIKDITRLAKESNRTLSDTFNAALSNYIVKTKKKREYRHNLAIKKQIIKNNEK